MADLQRSGYLALAVKCASRHLGETLEVAVTSVLQTTAGRMIFTDLKSVVPEKKYHSIDTL